MRKLFLFWVLAFSLVQAPFVFSLNCDSISVQNKDICEEILRINNLTDEEKILIISNLDYSNNLFPDHSRVYSYNSNLNINKHPQEIIPINRSYVKNAWALIFAVMPSVLYNGELYSPKESEVLSGFNYTLEIPSNYYSPGYPSTNGGDCKRIYTILQNTARNKVYVNNTFYGEGRKARISLDGDSVITSNYSILFRLKIDHYAWRSYCCKRRYGICRRTCYSCDFKNSETKEDNIIISSNKNVKFYPNELFAEISDLKQNSYSNEIKLNYSDSVLLNLKNSSFAFYKYVYSIRSSFAPYNIYTIEAVDLKQTKIGNLILTNKTINVRDIENCKLFGYDFFNKIESNCSLENTKINLSIKTDKTFFKLGQKINVSIYPKDILVNLTYGNCSEEIMGNIILDSRVEYNKIKVFYNGQDAEKIIFVFDHSRIVLIYRLVVIFILLILIYKLIKKYWRFI